jgi:hypothetical protein
MVAMDTIPDLSPVCIELMMGWLTGSPYSDVRLVRLREFEEFFRCRSGIPDCRFRGVAGNPAILLHLTKDPTHRMSKSTALLKSSTGDMFSVPC